MPSLEWTEETKAGVSLNRHTGRAGAIEVATVMYDGSNRFWVWSSPLADDAWGYGATLEGAKGGFEAWLRGWLENFRPFLDADR